MKNQYVADVGDYGKYSLLRFFANKGVKVGINWYLTEDDGTNDGKYITYLDKEENRRYDPVIFDGMRKLIDEGKRTVSDVESLNLIPGAVFYDEILSTTPVLWTKRKAVRERWHTKAKETLSSVDLIFADPDNGTIGAKSAAVKNAEKYTLLSEIEDYYKDGKDVVYYCQKARRNADCWNKKKTEMLSVLSDAKIITLIFHRGTQRSYIFVMHPESAEKYERLIDEFLSGEWSADKKPAFEKE